MEKQPDSSNNAVAPVLVPHGPSEAPSLIDFLPDVVCSLDREGRFVQVSAAARNLWGYEPAALAGRYALELVAPEDRERTRFIAESVRSGNELHDFMNHVRCSDGRLKPVIWSARWHAEQAAFYCIARDGSLRQKHERSNQQYQQRLEFMARATSEVIWEHPIDSEDMEVSGEKLQQLFGYEAPNNTLHRSVLLQKVHPEDVQTLEDAKQQALQQGLDFYVCEYRFQRKDGTWAYVNDRTYLIRDEKGTAVSMLGAMEDISAKRQAEQALVESEQSYRQLFDNAPLPTIISDAATLRILDVNSEAVDQYGYSREEFLNMNLLDLHTPEEQPRVLTDARSLRPDIRNTVEAITNLKKGGVKMLVEVSVTTTHYKGKAANLATIKNVTEKVRLQEALTQQKINHQKSITKAIIEAQESERSAIGRELHDNVNQVLASAKLYVENIQHYPEQRERFIERGTLLLNKSIEEIRRLSRELVTPTLRDIGFCDTVLELADSYGDLGLFEVECSFPFEEQALDPELKLTLYRILQEALNNTVRYARATLVQITLEQCGGALHLHYKDNGIGFDPATVKRGIGLTNIQNRADAYRGKVLLQAAPGSGCRFDIVFPLEG